MSRFIKLSNVVINTKSIIKIDLSQSKKFSMHLNNPNLTCQKGNKSDIIEVCKKKNPEDYNIVNSWITEVETFQILHYNYQ